MLETEIAGDELENDELHGVNKLVVVVVGTEVVVGVTLVGVVTLVVVVVGTEVVVGVTLLGVVTLVVVVVGAIGWMFSTCYG